MADYVSLPRKYLLAFCQAIQCPSTNRVVYNIMSYPLWGMLIHPLVSYWVIPEISTSEEGARSCFPLYLWCDWPFSWATHTEFCQISETLKGLVDNRSHHWNAGLPAILLILTWHLIPQPIILPNFCLKACGFPQGHICKWKVLEEWDQKWQESRTWWFALV